MDKLPNSHIKAYFVSGLGGDKRLFAAIRMPEHVEPVYLDWIPALQHESLTNYAYRLGSAIPDKEPCILVGLSMGGMIVTELAKTKNCQKLILISSTPTSNGLPSWYRWAGGIKAEKWVPLSFIKAGSLLKRFFSTESSKEKELLRDMIRNTKAEHLRWSMSAIIHWKQSEFPQSIVHIHGSKDRIIPIRLLRPTHVIPGAGHLMILQQSERINEILEAELSGLNKTL